MKPPVPSTSPKLRTQNEVIQIALGYASLVLIPVVLMLVVMAAKFQGLQSPAAWDHAQLARHIVAGDGLVTSALRPLSLERNPQLVNHPDLYTAPGHPLLLAVFFGVIHPSDRVAVLAGLMCWIAAVWLTFWIARQWFGTGTAILATIFLISNVAAITAAVGGLPQPVITLCVLGVFGLVFFQDDNTAWWRMTLAGALCALAMLTDYSLGILVIVIGWYLVASRQRKMRALGLFTVGLLLLLVPWLWRNVQHRGWPGLGLFSYDLLTNTRTYPGESVWRTMSQAPDPLIFLFSHPLEIVRKTLKGFGLFIKQTPDTLNPVVGFFFLAALPWSIRSKRTHALTIIVGVSLILGMVSSSLFYPEPQLLVVWTPLICMIAAVRLVDWIQRNIRTLSFQWLKIGEPKKPNWFEYSFLAEVMGAQYWGRNLAYCALVAGACLPLFAYLFLAGPTPNPRVWERGQALRAIVPTNAVVLTDQPAYVAWYANRRAVWLPQRESDLEKIEAHNGPLTISYITPGIVRLASAEYGDWWLWVLSPQGVYRGLVPAEQITDAVVRLRPAASGGEQQPFGLAMAVAQLNKSPSLADAHLQLGWQLLAQNRLREASDLFRKTLELDPQNTDAMFGLWQLTSRLNDRLNLNAVAQRIAALIPRDRAALLSLAEAARMLEQGLVLRPQDPWLLMQAAVCHAKLGHAAQVVALCDRAAAATAHAIPADLLLGEVYFQSGQLNQAASALERLAAAHPNDPRVHQALGQVYEETGQSQQALDEFVKVQRLHPGWPLPYVRAGYACLRWKQYDHAAQFFRECLRWASSYLPAQMGLAEALRLAGNEAEAIAVYQQIVSDYPAHAVALNNLAFLYAKTKQTPDRALAAARRAADLYPNNSTIQDTLGWVCYTAGRQEEATAAIEHAIKLAPANGLAHFHLGKVRLTAGNPQQARESFQAALDCGLPAEEKEQAQTALKSH